MRMAQLFTVISLGMAILLASVPAGATIYNLWADFSMADNPNGVWSYGYASTLTGAVTLYDKQVSGTWGGNVGGWYSNAIGLLWPDVLKNPDSTLHVSTDGITAWPAGAVSLHPGDNGVYSVVVWTAPATGNYVVSASFYSIGNNATTDVHVLVNGTPVLDANQPSDLAATSFFLNQGETIEFAVGWGNGGGMDTTIVAATIASVPIPAALLLFAPGLLGAAAVRRKFQNSRKTIK